MTTGSKAASRVRTCYCERVATLPVRPGIDQWISEAAARGVRCVVVTDNLPHRVHDALARLGLDSLVHTVVGRDELRARKPAPDVYRAALDQLGVAASNAIAVEDSPHGIAAATAAGVRCLAVPNKISTHLISSGDGVVIVDPEWVSLDRAIALLVRHTTPPTPARIDDPRCLDRICGSLAGLGLGDAIGKLIGKRSAHQLDAASHALLDTFADGGGPPALFTGRISDDTVLTLALAATVITAGRVSRDALDNKLRFINPCGGRQIYKLKASTDRLFVAADGTTNGCVPRSAIIGHLYRPDELGDLCYDTLKTVTLTHSHPDAVLTALVFAVVISHAVAGGTPSQTLQALPAILTGLTRIAGGSDDVGQAIVEHAQAAARYTTPAQYLNHLESAVGMAVAARSSAVAGICLGLAGLAPRQALPALLRRRARWDLDSVAAIYCALAGAFAPDSIPRIDDYHQLTR